jgi:hypothetical protein
MLRPASTLASACLVALAALALTGAASALRPVARGPVTWQTQIPARRSPCADPRVGPFTYHYPVKPFLQQHPIRGFFGDPRTVSSDPFGNDRRGTPGSFAFHNGVDIAAATGTPVYPVASGTVQARSYGDEVVVSSPDGRTFQYFHVAPRVHAGQYVVAYRTVLGVVLPEWHHVHLSELDGFRIHNPLDPGHLEPYRDYTVPTVLAIDFRTAHDRPLDPTRLHGAVAISADAEDYPPLPVPGAWFDFPVTPALVAWRLVSASGHTVVPRTVVADFRKTEPPNRDFWNVYTAGTYQNFPVFGHHFFWRQPGEYLFALTRSPLDTTRLRDGRYLLTVDVADVCGNRGSLTEAIDVRNRL